MEAFEVLAKKWRDYPDCLVWFKSLIMQGDDKWARDSAIIELKRVWRDDPEVQKLLERIEQGKPEF